MKNKNKTKKNLFEKIAFWKKKKQKSLDDYQDHSGMPNPYRDWKIILVGTVVFNIILVAGNYFIFYKVIQGELFSSNSPVDIEVNNIGKAELEETKELFNERIQRFESKGGLMMEELLSADQLTSENISTSTQATSTQATTTQTN